MIFGKDANLGSFNLKSQDITAGKFTSIVSNPSSISLTISTDLSFKVTLEVNVTE